MLFPLSAGHLQCLLPCYKCGLHIAKLVSHNTFVIEMNMKMLCICIISDFPSLLFPVFDGLVLLSHLDD